MEDDSFFFASAQADLLWLDEQLRATSHRQKEISGSSRNCWWRAAWASILAHYALLDDDEGVFFAGRLRQALGGGELSSDLTAASATLHRMLALVRADGVESIFTQSAAALAGGEEACREEPSNLQADGGCDAEAACQLLTEQILRLAHVPAEVRQQVIYACQLGDDVHIEMLCGAMAVQVAIFSQPWTWSLEAGRALDERACYLRVLGRGSGSPLLAAASEQVVDRRRCAELIWQGVKDVCLFVHHTSHFNLYLPERLFRRPRSSSSSHAAELDVASTLIAMGFDADHVQLAMEASQTQQIDELINCLEQLNL